MRVLYVEDNPANVFLVKRVAKMGQHEIVNFIDGREAIRKYDDVNPDLVLMDIQLVGETSGIEVVKELRAKGVTTPIIAVTAYAMVGDKERCIEAGCNDYLAKPLPIPRLIEIFQEYEALAKAKAASAPASTDTTADKPAPVAAASSEAVMAEAPKPQTPALPATPTPEAPEKASESAPSAPTVESVVQTPSEPVAAEPIVESVAQTPSEPVTATPTVESVTEKASEPVAATPTVEPAAEVKTDTPSDKPTDIHKVETKRINEETGVVLETKVDNAATVNPTVTEKVETPSETVQEQLPTSVVSPSIHEDVTLPEKSTVQESATVETPKTAASTTEANG